MGDRTGGQRGDDVVLDEERVALGARLIGLDCDRAGVGCGACGKRVAVVFVIVADARLGGPAQRATEAMLDIDIADVGVEAKTINIGIAEELLVRSLQRTPATRRYSAIDDAVVIRIFIG